jgi:hypothetical protein
MKKIRKRPRAKKHPVEGKAFVKAGCPFCSRQFIVIVPTVDGKIRPEDNIAK